MWSVDLFLWRMHAINGLDKTEQGGICMSMGYVTLHVIYNLANFKLILLFYGVYF